MRAYLAHLQQLADTASAGANTSAPPANTDYIPLETQIQQLMATMPENQRKRDWTMADFTSRLEGKYRAKPHAMKVGAALRRLGWYQHRDYSRQAGGARVWRYPE